MEPKELGKEVENGKVHDGLLHKPYVHLIRKGRQRKGYIVFVPVYEGSGAVVGYSLCKRSDKFQGVEGINIAIKRAYRHADGFDKVPDTIIYEYGKAVKSIKSKFPEVAIQDIIKF
jgi:hypothetical protein